MKDIIANVVYFIHLIIILAVVCVPFLNSPYFLLLHSVFSPFLVFHWLTNNNTCVLTTIEKKLRGIKEDDDPSDCITCKLIDPMFEFVAHRKSSANTIYVILILLWLISTCRIALMFHSGKVKNIHDLFVIRK